MSNNEIQPQENKQVSTLTHWTQCLIDDNADKTLEIAEIESGLTIVKCLESPLISEVKKSIPIKSLLRSVREIILNSARTFKFSENMDLGQATILANDILDYFQHESLEDIVQMFKMARKGELGSGKGRLDHDVVFNIFIPAYFNKKIEAREKQLTKEKESYLKSGGEMSDFARQKFQELSEMLSANRVLHDEPKPVVNHHQIWLNSLKNSVKNLSKQELYIELGKAKKSDHSIFNEAVKIYESEISLRK